ncbi:hypothetical protein [Sporichthya sp.]|uniref:hypothetical protein n=1 Tax=Sporichthya sp. TaxID=65475 RepID=UPI0017DDF266|nr:hypothetical protein [Sporichthya sp.]MBA3742604.1 hypothetical protein [Sporichthya sp.]
MHLSGSGSPSTGQVLTLEQRVAALEGVLEHLRHDLVGSLRDAEERANKTAAAIALDVRRQVEEQVAAVAALAVTNVGRGRRAYLGPALFVTGLLTQTLSSGLQIAA